MYDTSRGLVQVPRSVALSPRWGRVVSTTVPATGEQRTRCILNTPAGLHLTLFDGCALTAERSLPKALHGSNVQAFGQADVAPALAVVDREIEEALGEQLPPFASWLTCRQDYATNVNAGSEDGVRMVTRRLAPAVLPRKGRPVAGESGVSLAWGHGNRRVKVYGKHAESGEEAARGVLRVEVEVRRQGEFRKILKRSKGTEVRMREVLTPEVRETVLHGISDLLERVMMTDRELTDLEFAQQFVDFFSTGRALTLMGFCVAYCLAGNPTAKDISEGRTRLPFSRSSTYKYLADLRRFRQHLRAQGYHRPTVTTEPQAFDVGYSQLEEAVLDSDEAFVRDVAALKRWAA